MLGTPDFGHSDIWHQNFAFAYYLAQALKQGYFPVWVKDIGTGFPMLGDGEMGMFLPINIILYRFFDVTTAFNLTYVIVFVLLLTGTYFYARTLKFHRPVAFFAAAIFSFSGLIVTQLRSIHIVQAMSFFPWGFFCLEKFLQSKKRRWLFLLSIIISLQIYANYQQIVLITLISLAIYLVFRSWQTRDFSFLFIVPVFIVLGLILALPQIVPTVQMMLVTNRDKGTALTELVKYPYHPKNLLSLLNPYFWGDPRIGTYPPFAKDWGIFWESTGYIGFVPFLLALVSLVRLKLATNYKRPFLAILIVSLVLMLGKYTPAFFLFQLPPLSLFRVPARFLLPFVWALVFLSTLFLNQTKNKWILYIVILLSVTDLAFFGLNYHPSIDTGKWLSPPETVKTLQADQSWYRVYSYIPVTEWNSIFLKTGWKNMDNYFPFRNALDPNQNLFWHISSADLYVGLMPRRLEMYKNLIDRGLEPGYISSSSAKLLSLAGVKYYISTQPLNVFTPVATVSGDISFYLYSNPEAKPHAYLTTDFEVAKTLPDLISKLTDPAGSKTILEEDINLPVSPGPAGEVAVTKNTDLEVELTATANKPSLLILSDSFYPTWQAEIDGKPTKIYPANLNQRAVIIAPGERKIIFKMKLI